MFWAAKEPCALATNIGNACNSGSMATRTVTIWPEAVAAALV